MNVVALKPDYTIYGDECENDHPNRKQEEMDHLKIYLENENSKFNLTVYQTAENYGSSRK